MPLPDPFDALLDKTCTIQGLDPLADTGSYGHTEEAYVNVALNVPCRLSTLSHGREAKQEKFTAIVQKKIYMRYRSDIDKNCRIILLGVTYNIIDVRNPSSANHHLEILVEEIVA